MRIVETIAIAETVIVDIQKRLIAMEDEFALNHPARQAMADVRNNLGGVIRANRLESTVPQTKYVYKVESETPL